MVVNKLLGLLNYNQEKKYSLMHKGLFLFLYLLISPPLLVVAQTTKIDSLKQVIASTDDDAEKVNTLYKLALQYFGKDFTECERLSLASLELAEKNGNKDGMAHAHIMLSAARVYLGKSVESLNNATAALSIYEELKDTVGLASAYKTKASVHLNDADYALALSDYEKAIEYSRIKKLPKQESACIMNIGLIYGYLGDNDKAAAQYYESLKISEDMNDISGVSYCKNNIASIYFSQKKYDQAEALFSEALKMGYEINDHILIADCQSFLALIYFETQEYEKAMLANREAYDLDSAQRNYRGIATRCIVFGDIESGRKNYKKAKYQYELAIENISQVKDNTHVLSQCWLQYGRLFQKTADYPQAIEHLNKAILVGKKGGLREIIYKAYKSLSEISQKQGDYKNALGYFENYSIYKDSTLNENNNKNVNQLAALYKDELKKKEIEKLSDETKLQRAEAERRTQQNIILIISLLAMGGLALILWRSYNNKQKSNLILTKQKTAIEKQNDEKDILLKEIHHRVKNNLQVISSLLSLQSNTINDENVLLELQEGQNRVKSIALIHQKLYQNEDISTVDFGEYCEELIAYLRSAFNLPGKNYQILVQANDILLDIDTAVPLGLIINELISNSFKHAFVDDDEGQVQVSLKYLEKSTDKLILTVSDNGKGMPEKFDIENANSLGLRLVKMLSNQLDGEVSYLNKNGTFVTITLSNTNYRKSLE